MKKLKIINPTPLAIQLNQIHEFELYDHLKQYFHFIENGFSELHQKQIYIDEPIAVNTHKHLLGGTPASLIGEELGNIALSVTQLINFCKCHTSWLTTGRNFFLVYTMDENDRPVYTIANVEIRGSNRRLLYVPIDSAKVTLEVNDIARFFLKVQ